MLAYLIFLKVIQKLSCTFKITFSFAIFNTLSLLLTRGVFIVYFLITGNWSFSLPKFESRRLLYLIDDYFANKTVLALFDLRVFKVLKFSLRLLYVYSVTFPIYWILLDISANGTFSSSSTPNNLSLMIAYLGEFLWSMMLCGTTFFKEFDFDIERDVLL